MAEDRLNAIAAGLNVAVYVANNTKAEACVRRIRDDLFTLIDLFGSTPPQYVLRGIRAAWRHLATLTSLPSRPSDFDRFAGIPPLAARATNTFVREITACANGLTGDACEIATIIASDLDELRTALEGQPPYLGQLRVAMDDGVPTLAVVRTQTAAHALLYALGGDPTSDHFKSLHLRTFPRLYREGTWERAVVIGMPRPWEWHRLDSGISTDLRILALGRVEADRAQRTLLALHDARCRWGSAEAGAAALSKLTSSEVQPIRDAQENPPVIRILLAQEEPQRTDPFEAFEHLMSSTPLIARGETWADLDGQIADESEMEDWFSPIPATRIQTSQGVILLPSSRVIEVRQGDKIVDRRVQDLQPGMSLLISRREGRVGLLEAVADRLARSRPDLIAAHYLIVALQGTIRQAFNSSGMTKAELLDRLRLLGFDKSYQAMRGYVEPDGPIAPRDFPDLKRLAEALQIEWGEQQLREVFAGVQRYRVFRRSTGRALARASRVSAAGSDWGHIDPETGLSLADLREALIEAEILSVEPCPQPVTVSELGHLVPIGAA